MKRILLPIDFSEQSWKAILCALAMYQDAGVQFYLFYSEASDDYDGEENIVYKSRATDLQSLLETLEKMVALGQVIKTVQRDGNFIEDIKKIVFETKIDLIVLSTHYPNIFNDGVQGSHTRDVITRIKCPVLIVPRDFKCSPPKQVALLSDFNFKHRSQATTVITKFVKHTKAHLNILQLSKTGNALSETQATNKVFLKDALDTIPHSFHFVIEKTMDEALQFFVDIHQVDLVILFAKNINLSENILFSPTLNQDRDYHKTIPFLVVHE